MPILKQLVSGSAQTKRRSRMDLTREMISAPLGDFRHTMHVGRSGDAFGDTSFLSSRSGEPPPESTSYPSSPRPGLLSRTFRSSKRSQSVTRVDQQKDNTLVLPGGSPAYVKNAMSLPFLYDESGGDSMVSKSLSSSPLKQPAEVDGKGAAAATATHFLELEERNFGELTELPATSHHYGGGMKRAESVMSFHLDLGPSMLGDILGVMEKEDDDLGYEEGKSSEGRASPALSAHGDEEEDSVEQEKEEDTEEQMEAEVEEELEEASMHPAGSSDLEPTNGGPYTPEYTPETRPKHLQHLDSCSMSSSGSAALDEKPSSQTYAGDTDSATFSAPPEEESNFSSFLEDEDDEIRV
ncbi:cdc42 effector protein 4a [Labrus mixtus]|uniref:cdc42 effector protein 4a n=1 Tax=Labrus mixtus TaxID=508554 RepID=UPI0029C0C564|nr:cdc42 effector protein 4a [Labrus mixtus]XP_060882196.1 cdc42 effector protein 4a [Labrus mixtus]